MTENVTSSSSRAGRTARLSLSTCGIGTPEIDMEYLFTDTQKELPETYDFLNRLEAYLEKADCQNRHRRRRAWV